MAKKTLTMDAGTRTALGYGYDAIKNTGKRRAPRRSVSQWEDQVLANGQRLTLMDTSRDQMRNMTIPAWLVRKHLDYVTRFSFQSKSGNAEFDKELERRVKVFSLPENFDIRGRHSLQEYTRLMEQHRVMDGDFFTYLLNNGKIQGIEGDRVQTPVRKLDRPSGLDMSNVFNGVQVNRVGKATKYFVGRRLNGQLTDFSTISARDVLPLAYYLRYDQIRGISPLSTAINSIQDLKESNEAALIKAKMHAMLGIAFTRNLPGDEDGFQYLDNDNGQTATGATERYDFEMRNGVKVELDPGDGVEMIESKTPSTEFREYTRLTIQVIMLALDLPFSYFDSSKTSYSSKRGDILDYYESVKVKRAQIQAVLDKIIAWKIRRWERGLDGAEPLVVPEDANPLNFEWIPTALPWIDPGKEIAAAGLAVALTLDSPQHLIKQSGRDPETVLQEIKEWQDMTEDMGIVMQVGSSGVRSLGEFLTSEEDEPETENEDNDE